MNNISNKGRYGTDVSFESTSGQWYVEGQKRDGTGAYQWWGEASAPVQEGSKFFFGSADYNGSDRWIILLGANGYQCSGVIDSELLLRMNRINKRNKIINYIRLFGGTNQYFISDSEGTEWNGLGEGIDEELIGGKDKILDVVIAGDGSWIVVRPSRIITSHQSGSFNRIVEGTDAIL